MERMDREDGAGMFFPLSLGIDDGRHLVLPVISPAPALYTLKGARPKTSRMSAKRPLGSHDAGAR
jgi:hypothetical protein